jgi:nascent polypeptide-associated complex subunit alpha
MFPGMNMNSKQMKQAMKKMGMEQEEVEASKVIIETPDGDIVIENPNVAAVSMMGQDSWQITGDAKLIPRDTTPDVSEEDIKTVVDQTGCSEEVAKEKILEHKGDLAEAILELANNE